MSSARSLADKRRAIRRLALVSFWALEVGRSAASMNRRAAMRAFAISGALYRRFEVTRQHECGGAGHGQVRPRKKIVVELELQLVAPVD